MKKLQKIGGFAIALLMATTILVPANASAQTTTNMCSGLVRDLTLGSTGTDVVILQTFLEQKGYLTIPTGVSKGYFGALTKSAVAKYQAANSISPVAGYFGPLTRGKLVAACATTSTPGTGNNNGNNGGLSGEDGDIQQISETTSGTETTLGEGKTEDVLGFDLEADDNSDLEVTSVRVEIETGADGSSRLNRYLDSVTIMLDGEEVGSVDASDFSRDSSVSRATISLDDAIVEAGEEARFYVTLTANDSINDSDLDNTIEVSVTRVRVEDGAGAILTEDVSNVSATVDFEDATANDDARIKSSSDSRDAGLLKVEANKSSDQHDLMTFEFDVDEDSSDAVVLEIPVELSIYNNSTTTALNVEAMIKDLSIEVDGETYDDFDFDADVTIGTSSTETVITTFTIDEGDLEITAGDVIEVVLFVELNEQNGNYTEGSTIDATVVGANIVAENTEGDVFDFDGTANGEVQTLQIAAATVENFNWSPSVNSDGTVIDFIFTVTAEDEDFDVLSSSIVDTISGTASTSAGVLTKRTGDADTISGGFKVLDGDTATFRVRYSLTGSNGTYGEVTMTSVVGQEVPDDDQVSPTVTINVN